ncbi:hypothetical protein DL766_009811 [Monosporascus sp. MC13-8B]|uniref:N-acetyltransferase domain-containing protein n=1 Tax=Monosporascus cannonballus TaxID=155416 RepID=A0ABY0GR78_9PEZI|nr:hypothetical protein DL762_010479 [Monosporascus cannonballus]RYO78697.1 hypothetical protein DL763_009541 [Monosporascus cannonballus]RYP13761.1 hypothetical protein DL766_009811 [Monosporascus sp. MC13-8B]
MRFNENIAVSASKVLLVPYDAHHVLRYHEWMQDPAIQEATASEPLTLDEEYENQQSWRTSHDKLTFIVCQALESGNDPGTSDAVHGDESQAGDDSNSAVTGDKVHAGEVDTPERMVGDINLFLTPWEEDEDGDGREINGPVTDGAVDPIPHGKRDCAVSYCNGEVDIMIADRGRRGNGLGISAVSTLLHFIRRHLESILAEYGKAREAGPRATVNSRHELKDLVAKINAANVGSIALFTKLGFEQRGEVNYFGEIEMVLEDFGRVAPEVVDGKGGAYVAGYRELVYERSNLNA